MSRTPQAGLPDTLLAQLFGAKSEAQMARPAMRAGDAQWTYAELRAEIEHGAHLLRACGVGRGDRVLFTLPNSPEFVIAFLAVTALGAAVVPVDFMAGPERLTFIARDTEPVLCLHPPEKTLPDDFAVPHRAITVTGGVRLEPAPDDTPRATSPEVADAQPAVILFSAGSTGRPKGAVLEHRQLLRIARTLVGIIGMDREHVDLILSPMTHSGGWQRVTSTLLAGGCVVVAQGLIAVPTILADVRDHGVRAFFAAPPLLRALLMSPPERVRKAMGTLRSIESASAPLSPDELHKLLELLPGANMFFQYGLTECSRAFILDTRAHPDKLHTVGLATAGVEVQITDDDGRALDPGEKGEVWLAAPQRAGHYWNRPDLNKEKFRDRWLMTGDVGSLDAQGFLTFHGRRDNMINCGGLSYFPAEVERELGPVAGISDYIVAGVPDPKGILGQVPWVFAVAAEPDNWKPATLIKHARDRLPPHMLPRRVVVIPEMPFITAGKPDRRKIVADFGPAAEPRA